MAILILALGIVYADTDDSATGSFGLNAPPIVTNVNFVDSSYALTGSLTPDDSTIFGVNFTLQHSSTLAWIRNVTVYIFDDSIHGSDWASADPDGIQLTAPVKGLDTDVAWQASLLRRKGLQDKAVLFFHR